MQVSPTTSLFALTNLPQPVVSICRFGTPVNQNYPKKKSINVNKIICSLIVRSTINGCTLQQNAVDFHEILSKGINYHDRCGESSIFSHEDLWQIVLEMVHPDPCPTRTR